MAQVVEGLGGTGPWLGAGHTVRRLSGACLGDEQMTTQTEAERLATALTDHVEYYGDGYSEEQGCLAAAELRRLVSFNNDLKDEVARLQKREWVGLTKDERMSIINGLIGQDWAYALDAIEAKLKEKNT